MMESPKSNLRESATPDDVTAAPRVQSPVKDRVQSPTNIAASESSSVTGRQETPLEAPQETLDIPVASSNMNDGPLAYPFKIRNPIPGYTSSAASSTGEASDVQTSSTLFPSAGSLARPISSLHAFSDKEFVMQPAEKEVSMDSYSNPSTPTDGRNMPFRMRNHPSVNGLNNLTTVPTNSSQVSSIPTSPAGQYRNPAFDPRNVASRVFGASPQHEMSNPYEQIRVTPPKPVGFAYNPRDLRNAMLNRAAAENAAAASASLRGDSPAPPSSARSQYHHSSPAFGDPVELPAVELPAFSVQHRPSHETLGRDSTTSHASDNTKPASAAGDTPTFNFDLPNPDPVELSATPSSRKPIPPTSAPSASTAAPSTNNRKDLSVKENITMPVAEQQQQQQTRNSRPPPPLPPKDDPSPDQRPPPRSPIDFLSQSKSPDSSQPRVQTKAPMIGEISGLREESGKGLDLGLAGVNGHDEDKPPAWL
jgi:hypothetical protein